MCGGQKVGGKGARAAGVARCGRVPGGPSSWGRSMGCSGKRAGRPVRRDHGGLGKAQAVLGERSGRSLDAVDGGVICGGGMD